MTSLIAELIFKPLRLSCEVSAHEGFRHVKIQRDVSKLSQMAQGFSSGRAFKGLEISVSFNVGLSRIVYADYSYSRNIKLF